MARNITTAFNTALQGKVVTPIIGTELDFSDGILRFWNGYGNLTMVAGGSSKVFTGLGDFLGLSPVSESSTLQMSGITLSFTGIKSSLISTALSANYTNRNGSVYLGLYDTSNNIIADVYTLFQGKMDVLNISEQGNTSTITLNIESRLISFDLPSDRKYTLEDQKVDFPNDLGFEFIPDLQDKEITWGKETS